MSYMKVLLTEGDLLPLLIKLGLMKQLLKALDKECLVEFYKCKKLFREQSGSKVEN